MPQAADLGKARGQVTKYVPVEIGIAMGFEDPPRGEDFRGNRAGVKPRRIRDSVSKTRNWGIWPIYNAFKNGRREEELDFDT